MECILVLEHDQNCNAKTIILLGGTFPNAAESCRGILLEYIVYGALWEAFGGIVQTLS